MRSTVILILIIIAMNTAASENTAPDTSKVYLFDPVTITATRTESNRSVVAPSISIVPKEILVANPDKSIFSLVSREVPGVFVQQRGILGFGVTTSTSGQMSIRGVGGNPNTQVLMMIDGRPQYMGMFGHPLADSYLSANAERIEVIRGPASVLYGSNAMGGVVNVITHSNQKPGVSGDVTLSYGSHNSQHLGAKTGYQADNWNVLGSFTHEHTDGHRPQSEFDANSGYLKALKKINEKISVTLDGSLTDFTTYDPGTITAPKTQDNYVDIQRGYAGVSIDNDFGVSKGAARFIYNFGHHEVFDGSDWISDDFNAVFSLFQTLTLIENNAITVGMDYNEFGGEGKNKTREYGAPSTYEYALYANVQHTFFSSLVLNGGMRYTKHELFGNEIVPQLGVSYRLSDVTTLRASASKGYRSPTIRELFLFPAPTPSLKPERLWNYETGLTQTIGRGFFAELTVFQAEGSNLILASGRYPNMTLSNSGSFIHRGIEIAGTYLPPVDNLQMQGNYTYIDPGNETCSFPQHKLYLSVQYAFNIFNASISAQHIKDIYGSNNSKDPLPDYTLANFKVNARVTSDISISLGVDNLLDETYYTMLGYPMPGTTVTAGIHSTF
ncbi:MAG: TonB-dependent receptor [Bacteroidetes bacterium]|nr:TonB-dependent receptor [Bacteroidota bacterium]